MVLRGAGRSLTNVLDLAIPPQRHRPDTQPEHQDPVSHTAQKKSRKERKRDRVRERKKERKGKKIK